MPITTNIQEFRVNQQGVAGDQTAPLVARLATGGFVVVYRDVVPGAATASDVRFQLFDAAGNAVGGPTNVSSQPNNAETPMDVIAMGNGSFVVSWLSAGAVAGTPPVGYGATGSAETIVATRAFTAGGAALSAEVASFTSTGAVHDATSAALFAISASQYAVFWSDTDDGVTTTTIRSRSISTAGVPGLSGSGAPVITPPNALTVEDVQIAQGGSQAVLLNDRFFFAGTPGSVLALGGDLTEIRFVQNGFYLAIGSSNEKLSLVGLSGTGTNAATYVASAALVVPVSNGTSISLTGTTADVKVEDLGGGRFLIAWMANIATQTGAALPDGLYGIVFNTASQNFETGSPQLLAPFSGAFDSFSMDALLDGRVAVVFQRSVGLSQQDVFAQVVDPRAAGALISGNNGNNSLIGTTFGDTINGFLGADSIFAGDGNDTINPGGGADTVDGGDGGDTISYVGIALGIVLDLQNRELNEGEAALDTLISIEGVIGTSGNDEIFGNSAGNTIDGGAGFDVLNGRAGDDRLLGGASFDFADGGEGNDQLFGGDDSDVLFGGAGNDFARGDAGNDGLAGGIGSDTLAGGPGLDRLVGGADGDLLSGNGDGDQMRGGAGQDTLLGGAGNDVMTGEEGDDVISGGLGNDRIASGQGNDVIDGGANTDTVSYQHFRPTAAAGSVFIDLDGTSDPEVSVGGPPDPEIGGSGPIVALDTLYNIENAIGSIGNDQILGTFAGNFLTGGRGDDLLVGRLGADVLTGGSGIDRFRYEFAGDGGDSIRDFTESVDVIEIRSSSFSDTNGSNIGARFVASPTGAPAANAGPQFLFDTTDAGAGTLIFDINGNVAGGAVTLAVLSFTTVGGLAAFGANDFAFV